MSFIFKQGYPQKLLIPVKEVKSYWHKNIRQDFKPYQPYIDRLVKKIRIRQKIAPILVVKEKDGYVIVDGHHRVFACLIAGKKLVPAILIEGDFEDTKLLRKAEVALKEYDKKTGYKYHFSRVMRMWTQYNSYNFGNEGSGLIRWCKDLIVEIRKWWRRS